MRTDLILVANASAARLFCSTSDTEPLVPLATLEHDRSRRKGSQLGNQRAGHGSSDHRPGGVSFMPRLDSKRKQHLQFADELAQRIDVELASGRCSSVALFASCPFIGELKQRLSPAARKALRAAIDTDLTSFPLDEVERRVRQELRAGQALQRQE
jgi:protein required for attachment to host cells